MKGYQNQKKQAFTLLELIISITLLAILGTISFVSFQDYFGSSRDTVRVSDIKNLHTGLSLYKIKSGKALLPDAYVTIQAGSNVLSFQGEIGENGKRIINIDEKIKDPKTEKNYIYTTDKKQNKFQLMGYLEKGENVRYVSFISQTHAEEITTNEYNDSLVYVYGDKLGVITDENKTPIQYTISPEISEIDLSSEAYQDKNIIIYLGGDAYDEGKKTTTGGDGVAIIESSINGELLCGETSYNGYTILSATHNQVQTATKIINILNGNQVLKLQVSCINGDWDLNNASENIENTNCTTEGYIAYNNECILNNCTTPTTGIHSDLTYSLISQGLAHGNSVTITSENRNFGTSPAHGITRANFTFSCNTGVISITNTSNYSGSCTTSGYDFNNNYTSPQCAPSNCTTPTTGIHSGLTYSLISQGLAHGNSVTITSENRNFGTSPAHGITRANFTFSCNAGVISITNTSNHSGSCTTSGYDFNNNYTSPQCTSSTCIYQGNVTQGGFTYNYARCPDGKLWTTTHLKHTPTTGSSWCYSNTASNCTNYGRLYNLAAANSICGTLGTGWRLPGWEWIDMRERFSNNIPASLGLVNVFPGYIWNGTSGNKDYISYYWLPYDFEGENMLGLFGVFSGGSTSWSSSVGANQSTSGFSVYCIKD